MSEKDRLAEERHLDRVFWLKGLAILLIIIFAFTIVSRVTASVTVAKVTVTNVSERKIQHVVLAEGRVEHNGEFAVVTEPDLLIRSVEVREGETAEKGEVLFRLDLDDLAEQIEDIQGQIQALELQNAALQENKDQSDAKRNTDIQRAKEDYANTVKKNEDAVAAAEQELVQAEEALARAGQELAAAQEEDSEAKQTAYDACKAAVNEKTDILNAAKDTSQTERKAAERALEDAKNPVSADNSAQINDITRKELESKLEKLKTIENQEGQVTAPESGVITKLDVSAGQKTTDVAAVTMSDNNAGLRFIAQIGREDGAYVSAGDTVTLQGVGKSEEKCEIASVEADETGEVLTVTVNLDADTFQMGESASMKAVRESKEYSCTVPVTSLLQENGKMFVLIADTEDTILGEQYVARKAEVSVLDKNADYAALDSTSLGGDSQIITDTDRYVEAGDRVRLTEE